METALSVLAMVFWMVFLFAVGASIGSFLNVCVARLPYEKSLLWPGSRCGSCFQPILVRDNIPVISYLVLRGRCRTCGARFSVRYCLVELLSGLAFAGLFALLVFLNVRKLDFLDQQFGLRQGMIPLDDLPKVLLLFTHHATLLSFLLVTSLCDLDDMEIPLGVTVTGTVVGLIYATLLPWPYPNSPPLPHENMEKVLRLAGVYPWPVWYPLPDWLPAGSWQLGLATGLGGAAAGLVLLRGVRFVFGVGRGTEGLGVGDADLMMMAGAFIGWQPVVMAFFLSVVPGLLIAVVYLFRKGHQGSPFGPSLAAGVLLALLAWPWVGPAVKVVMFDAIFLGFMVAAGTILLLVLSLLLRLRGMATGGGHTAGS
jgi:leader peptidase (prepilin peptidase)/N-methyltransferase